MGSGQSVCQLETESGGSVAKIGQGFGCAVSSTFGQLQGEVLRQTRSYKEIAGLSYEEFQEYIVELNEISSLFLDANGKQLVFAVKKGTDSTALWKGTVRVACVKVDASSKAVDSYRLLTLKQFLAIFKSLQTQTAAIRSEKGEHESSADSSEAASTVVDVMNAEEGAAECSEKKLKHPLTVTKTASMFLEDALDNTTSLEECCVCLERKPDVILPCAHSYCLPCIEQWNVNHKTCPVCRETVESTDDGWVVSDGPDSLDIATEIQKTLMELAQD